MIEAAAADDSVSTPAPPAEEGVTAGAMLRQAREAAGLHVAALAVSLKVPVRKLEALETDRYDLLPDAVFARALASSICRTLKIDPQAVLERLPQGTTPRLLRDSEGLNAPFRASRDGTGPGWPEQFSKPVVISVLGLLLAALVLVFLPRLQSSDEGTAPDVKSVEAPPAETIALAEPERTAAPQPAATVPASAPASGVMPATLPAPAALPQAATPALASASAPPAAQAAATAVPASGILLFRTRGASWVEVTDAKGVVAFRKLMAAGETGAASGATPLRVTVGRADVTEIQVRGKAFDLRRVAKDNVARFEVK